MFGLPRSRWLLAALLVVTLTTAEDGTDPHAEAIGKVAASARTCVLAILLHHSITWHRMLRQKRGGQTSKITARPVVSKALHPEVSQVLRTESQRKAHAAHAAVQQATAAHDAAVESGTHESEMGQHGDARREAEARLRVEQGAYSKVMNCLSLAKRCALARAHPTHHTHSHNAPRPTTRPARTLLKAPPRLCLQGQVGRER